MEHILDKTGLTYLWGKIKARFGINSVSVSVDNNTGIPSGSASLSEGILSFVFQNLKGEKGDTIIIGNEDEYTLYNSLGNNTDGAMTQAKATELFYAVMDILSGTKFTVKVVGSNLSLNPYYAVNANGAFLATSVAKAGYGVSFISVTMGNTDITSTAYSDNAISIPGVSGNVLINAATSNVVNVGTFSKRTTADGLTLLNNKALLKGVKGNSGIWTQFRPNTLDTSTTGTGHFFKSSNYTLTLDDDGVFTMSNFTIKTSISYYHFGFWFTRVTDHKYYISCQVYIDTDTTQTYGRFGMGFTANNTTVSGAGYNTARNKNTWANIRAITELLASGSYCMLATYNAASGSQRWLTENTTIKIKNIRCVDLTKLFGAGNEPTTTAEFERLFPISNMYDYTTGIVLNNSMTNYVSKDGNEETLQNVSLNVPTLTGKLNGEGESVVVFLNGMKSSCNEAVNDTYDEIKQVDGVWKAIKRIGTERATSAISGRVEYEILAQEEVYILDDQTIPTEITVADQGVEEILPAHGSTPTTAPSVIEIQYGATNE